MSAADVLTRFRAWLDQQPHDWASRVSGQLEALVIEDAQRTAAKDCAALDFAAFWAAYPRKIAKAAAWKAWAKLDPSPVLFAEIMAALEIQKRQIAWVKDDGAFVPHAATWINGRRWEDQIGPLLLVPDTAAATEAMMARSRDVIAEREALLKGRV